MLSRRREQYRRISLVRESRRLKALMISKSHSGSSFGSVLGNRSQEGRKLFLQYCKGAIEVPSEATTQIEAISAKHNVFLVVGVIERALGTLYCSVIFVHPSKGLLGKHRKIMPTAVERLVWGQGDGTTLPVLQESFKPINADSSEDAKVDVKISATICWYVI